MLPTINKRFLLKLVVVTAVLAGALFGAHAIQAGRIPDALRRQAELAADLSADDPKKVDSAVFYLRQYLEFKPDDVEALERLTGVLRKRNRPADQAELIRLYDRVLRTDPNRHDTRREALKATLLARRFTDAETHAQALLKEFPKEQTLWLDLAFAQRGLQKPQEVLTSYETAITCDPKQPGAYQEFAEYLLNDLKQKDEAKAVLDRLVAAVPASADSYTARGRYFAAIGNEAAAIADSRKALELSPDNADALLQLGEQLQKRREEVAAAADLYRAGIKAHPTDPRFVRSLAWLEVNSGNLGAAVAVLEDGSALVNEQDALDLTVPLADLLLQMRDTDRAKKLIASLQTRSAPTPARKRTADLQAQYLKGRLAMSEQRWEEAIALLTKLRQSAADLIALECQVNLLLSLCHQRRGEFDQEEQALKLILDRDPSHGAARRGLGDFYLNAGRLDDAIAEYEQAARNRFATPDCRVKLFRMKASKLRSSGATKPMWAELDAQLTQYEPTFGKATAEYALLRAETLTARGDTARAYAVLRAEAMRRPADAALWARYATTAADVAGAAAGLAILDEAQAVCGDRADLRLARAGLYARDPSRLRPIDPLAAQIDMWPEAEQLKLLFGLVDVFDRVGDEGGVVRTYRRIAGRYPSDTAVWEGLFDRATRGGDATTANEARRMLAKYGSGSQKSTALLTAWEVANGKRANEAVATADALTREFGPTPDRADVCVALARLRLLAGDGASAHALLTRAVRLEPVRFGPTQELLAFLTARGPGDQLTKLVARLGADFRWRGEPLRRAVRQTVQRVEPAAAKQLLAAVQPVVLNEPDGLGWLGDCYTAAGCPDDARRCYEQAVAALHATADDWMRLAVRTADGGDKDAAARVIATARAKLPSPQVYLMTAAVFADTAAAPGGWKPGLTTPAERKLFTQARLAVKLSCFHKDQAVALLDDFLADKGLPVADVAWAKRNLAMLLAARGTGPDRTRAKDLLTGADANPGDTVDDRRATAAVLAGLSGQLEGEARDQVMAKAIEVLAGVVQESKNPRDKFLLAQVYRTSAARSTPERAAANRLNGRRLLQELIKDDPRNVEYYVAALDEATEEADRAFAEKCATYLLANHPADFRVIQSVARFECRAGRPAKALEVVTAYARTADATPGDLQRRTGQAAELLDELGRRPAVRGTDVGRKMIDAAVEKYEQLFAVRPEVMVAVAGLLAHDGRAAEAFTKLDRYAKLLPTRVKVLTGLAVLRGGPATAAQWERVRGWLEAAATEEPGSVAVRMNEGEFYTLKADLPSAEKAYAAALAFDDQNVVALNNLAWVLSANPDTGDRALELVDKAVRVIGMTGELLDTRARVKIARKEYAAAEADLTAALSLDRTPLRLFHLALATRGGSPEAAKKHYKEAKERGLREATVHPTDVPAMREMEKEYGG